MQHKLIEQYVKWITLGITGVVILIAGIWYSNRENAKPGSSLSYAEETESASASVETFEETESGFLPEETAIALRDESLLYVYICGAIVNPEVYGMPKGARIRDVIELAGGLSEEANANYINQAELVYDGEMIYIPYEGEDVKAAGSSGGAGTANANTRVNLNTASVETLMTLPGIGQNKAQSIVDYRNRHGFFTDITEITNVSGIGESIYERIRDYICI